MSRRTGPSLKNELRELERQLASLTVRVANIRTEVEAEEIESGEYNESALGIGDQVRFHIKSKGHVVGRIIRITKHRVVIKHGTSEISRAPHNVERVN
jgi:hypothetical protein